MDSSFFVRGLLIGFSVAAVVGPIGILCINRTMRKGFWYGLVTGLGAATADGIYGSVAAFGLTVITAFLVNQLIWIRLIGGLFLIYLGIKALLTKPAERAAEARANNFLGAYVSTLLLTLTNPTTILSFIAVLAGLGVGGGGNAIPAAMLVVCGVFLGSGLWWVLLSGGISLFRGKLNSAWFLWINRASGCVIVLFGLYALYALLSVR
ncbi:MAG TPA: LysE family transporter [Ktedonosporobacter sp.]|nr:LysE family transporter [Ktedonosporobacter sp.]